MSVVSINSKEDADNLFASKYKVIVIDHYADWCGPCKFLAPKYEELARQYSSNSVIFAKCDAEKRIFPDITGLPTIEFYVNNRKVEVVQGADLERIKQILISLFSGSQQQQYPVGMPAGMDNGMQQPLGSFQQTAPSESKNSNPYSTGRYKTGSRGKSGGYAKQTYN